MTGYSSNEEAAQATVRYLERKKRLEEEDALAVTNLLTLAKAVDAKPGAAILRKEYREAAESLLARHEHDADATAGFLDGLRAGVGDPAPDGAKVIGLRDRQRAERAGNPDDVVAAVRRRRRSGGPA